MAKGITQEQVNQAADSLLLAGERPTIERIRAVLGTGSPNTVNRYLDTWWVGLGDRLTQANHKVAMPDAPGEVATLANQLWELALVIAKEQARIEVEAERRALVDERAAISSEQSELEAQLVQLKADRDTAVQANDAASLRLADLQRLVEHQTLQLTDLGTQRDRAHSDMSRTHADLVKQQVQLQQRQQAWDAERSSLEATHVAMQDRWLGEVDRARQDEAKLAAKQKQLEHASELSARKAAEHIADLSKRLLLAEREEAKKTTRMSSLEDEIKRLHTQLKARLQASTSKPIPSQKKAKKAS